jgi:ADP-heptose:LPS heptosyltransferase
MRTKTKVILDEWFGRGFVILLNVVARILGLILRIDHSLAKKPNRIVVCKFLGMGSIIQATPLLQTLRKNFPEAEIIFLTAASNRKLLESIGVIDKIYDIDDSDVSSVIRTSIIVLRSLWEKKADLYIDLETYSFYSTAIATMSCARNRFGFYRVERNIRMGVYTHMMFFNARAPIAQSYLQMARLAGCMEIIDKLYPFIILESDRMSYRRKLIELTGDITGDIVVINPNASDLRIERRWPYKNFIELIFRLRITYPEKIFVLIGSANEFNWVNRIYLELDDHTKKRVFNSAGKFTLYELFVLIENSKLVISNDTGPMHISFALERPTVSLFGPASPSQYGQNKNALGIYKNVYCSPCVHDFLTPPCRGDNQCMKQITVDEVEALSKQILLHQSFQETMYIDPIHFLKRDGKTSLGIVERGK